MSHLFLKKNLSVCLFRLELDRWHVSFVSYESHPVPGVTITNKLSSRISYVPQLRLIVVVAEVRCWTGCCMVQFFRFHRSYTSYCQSFFCSSAYSSRSLSAECLPEDQVGLTPTAILNTRLSWVGLSKPRLSTANTENILHLPDFLTCRSLGLVWTQLSFTRCFLLP